ncbi:MAG: PID-CTERM protein-sorting domain-containing protein [Flavobacteriales bacterium]
MKRLFILSVFLVLSLIAYPQPPGPPDPPGGGAPPCGPPLGDPCIPIDGGVSLLIAAGLALGGKKAYDAARKK